jgi:hypothetical protein
MADETTEALAGAVARAEETGALGSLEFEHWFGGGQPPPYYRSEQLRLYVANEKPVLEFAKMTWDKTLTPPEVNEKWAKQPLRDDIVRVARLVRESRLLTTVFPEETPDGVGSGFSHEIILTAGKHKVLKKYYGKLPPALVPLKEEVDKLLAAAQATGSHGRYHQGRRL